MASHGSVSMLAPGWDHAAQFVVEMNLEWEVTHSFFLLSYPTEDNTL